MNPDVIQIVALALNGNARLQGFDISRFWPGSLAFAIDGTVTFRDRRDVSSPWEEVAPDPLSWLGAMQPPPKGYRLHLIDDELDEIGTQGPDAFTGGSRWMIEVVGEGASSVWEKASPVSAFEDDEPVWERAFYCIEPGWTPPPFETDLPALAGEFARVLRDALAFARAHRTGFHDSFEQALSELESNAPDPFGGDGVTPAAFPALLEARRLLAAAQSAWVFGGMGSWNDMGFDDDAMQASYDALSRALFNVAMRALRDGTNASVAG